MEQRTTRWLIITVCLAIPVSIVWLGSRVTTNEPASDPAYPTKCTAIFRQATTGDEAKALEAARKLVSDPSSTREEQLCSTYAADKLALVAPASQQVGLIADDLCVLAKSLEAHGATPAALAVFRLASVSADLRQRTCGLRNADRLAATVPVAPKCAAIARRIASASESSANEALLVALGSETTRESDADCLARVRQTVAALNAVRGTVAPVPDLEMPLANECAEAAQLARKAQVEKAREEYEQFIASPVPSDEVACATGGLSRLPPRPTFVVWSFDRLDGATQRVTGWVVDPPLTLGNGSKSKVLIIVGLLALALLVVALRQFIRWRRERYPGPVKIEPVDMGDDETPVVDVIRETLMGAGVAPSPLQARLGQVAVDVVDVLSAGGGTGFLASIAAAITKAFTIETGVILSAARDHDADDEQPYRLVVQLTDAGSGNTFFVESFGGESYRAAAEQLAYGVYLQLSGREEVLRRTASFLRWNTIEGLRNYQDGLDALTAEDYDGALKCFRNAATTEVGNLVVQLGLTRAFQALADQQRATDMGDSMVNDLRGLLAALRAVRLDGYSVVAHAQLGLAAIKVRYWESAWSTFSERADVEALLHTNSPIAHVATYFTRLSDKSWRRAQRRTWWPVVLYAALWLDRRRSEAGYVRPFSRRRTALHDVVLGAVVATGYDILASQPPSFPARLCDEFRLWCGLWSVRFGRCFGLRRSRDRDALVEYNIAAAFARRAVYRAEPDLSPARMDASTNMKWALKALQRSVSGARQRVTTSDLTYIDQDPDFTELRETRAYKSWRARFRTKERDFWVERFESVARGSDAASRWWSDHLLQPVPTILSWRRDGVATWAQGVVTWFGDDVERWSSLAAWVDDPTSDSARAGFERSVREPPFNKSRVEARAVQLATNFDAAAAWHAQSVVVAVALSEAREAFARALESAEHREYPALADELQTIAHTSATRWESVAAAAWRPR